ncbi:MAG: amidinotransferase [Sphingomonas sp.]|nr:amidinotransferase [Sphingomonas sp.]
MRDDRQTSDTVLLVRPVGFGFHAEAALSNAFSSAGDGGDARAAAVAEFQALRAALEEAGVRCRVLEDTDDVVRPDAVFPNNWVSFHGDGTIITYPMTNIARRLERRLPELMGLLSAAGLQMGETIDLSPLEQEGAYLEGTGSLIFDRPNARAFACRSPRTSDAAVAAFMEATGWEVLLFDAADRDGRQIYHTNVMLMIGSRFAILCPDAIAPGDRLRVVESIAASGRELIAVDFGQMERFACNLIELRSADGSPLIALSTTALDALAPDQRAALERLGGRLIVVDIPTIERVGGGSVRCMIADLHLPRA